LNPSWLSGWNHSHEREINSIVNSLCIFAFQVIQDFCFLMKSLKKKKKKAAKNSATVSLGSFSIPVEDNKNAFALP